MALTKAAEVIATGNVETAVDAAISMNREAAALSKEVDGIKGFLREAAGKVVAKDGTTKTDLAGTLGVAQVVFPVPSPGIVKGKEDTDVLALKDALPAEVFASLFTEVKKVKFAEDFEEKLATLTPQQKAVVGKLVEMKPATPRVNLPK